MAEKTRPQDPEVVPPPGDVYEGGSEIPTDPETEEESEPGDEPPADGPALEGEGR